MQVVWWKEKFKDKNLKENKLTDIEIRRLEIFAKHGVFKEEQTLGQKFYLNIYLKAI